MRNLFKITKHDVPNRDNIAYYDNNFFRLFLSTSLISKDVYTEYDGGIPKYYAD